VAWYVDAFWYIMPLYPTQIILGGFARIIDDYSKSGTRGFVLRQPRVCLLPKFGILPARGDAGHQIRTSMVKGKLFKQEELASGFCN